MRVYTSDFTDIKTIESKHSKAVTVITSNNKVVASGDAYRYMFVFDGESHEELFSSGDHKDKILDLYLTETHLVSVTSDMAFGVTSIEEKKFLRQQKLPHDAKAVFKAIVKDGQIITMGADCALRFWSL